MGRIENTADVWNNEFHGFDTQIHNCSIHGTSSQINEILLDAICDPLSFPPELSLMQLHKHLVTELFSFPVVFTSEDD